MAGAVRLVVVLALVVVAATPAGAAGADLRGLQTQVETDGVLLAVELEADGDARWRVAYRTRLDDDNTTRAFESLQRDIQSDPENFTRRFRGRMVTTAASAENATGREMAIRNVTVSAETKQLPREYGVVTYRFTWTNFAATDGPRLRAGDALRGLFLDERTTLLLSWPGEYRVESVAPRSRADVGDDQVAWPGPLEFADGEPALVLTTEPAGTTATTAPGGGDGPGDGGDGGLSAGAAVAILVLVAVGIAGGLYAVGRMDGLLDGTTAGADGDAAGGTAPPEELLSNEEQVLELLEQHDGRVKQQQIVRELDWTEAKTSQIVGDLREAGDVETFRIGRENVVTLPDEEL